MCAEQEIQRVHALLLSAHQLAREQEGLAVGAVASAGAIFRAGHGQRAERLQLCRKFRQLVEMHRRVVYGDRLIVRGLRGIIRKISECAEDILCRIRRFSAVRCAEGAEEIGHAPAAPEKAVFARGARAPEHTVSIHNDSLPILLLLMIF